MENRKLSNKAFCYWLQGYFEIAQTPCLDERRLAMIRQQLDNIMEPFGLYTSWLKQAVDTLRENNYCQHMIEYLSPMIMSELNHIFQHDIDNSYDTPHSAEYLLKIHRGEIIPAEST